MDRRIPLVIVYTGNGKGKTTAAMGLVMRTLGHQKRCAVLQFIKPEGLETGEKRFSIAQGVLWENYGEGFLWRVDDTEPSRKACLAGWERAKELICDNSYEMVVLDEFTYALNNKFVPVGVVVDFLKSILNDEQRPHIVITGRDAPSPLVNLADMVHEIVEVKHPWRTARVKAQKCIEF